MKMIVAGAAFATFLAPAVFAQPQRIEGPPASKIYLQQKQQSGVDYQLTPNPDPTEQWPCSTAPDFCPDYHGDNGG